MEEGAGERLEMMIDRRISGEPLQYIVGHQEFWSIDLTVTPRVLIPRPETELLVEQALAILSERSFKPGPWVLDVGTGSGAIAIALAKEIEDIFVVATDISKEALNVAKENARRVRVGEKIQFVQGDLLCPFRPLNKKGPFDLMISNPPYIDRADIGTLEKEVKDHEPIIALDGGREGLDFYRQMALEAPSLIRQGGWFLLEIGHGQGQRVLELVGACGAFSNSKILFDLAGRERVVKAEKSRE